MSFFGFAILARHTGRLDQLPCIADIDSFAGYHEVVYGSGWRLGLLDTREAPPPARIAAALAAATGAPAAVMYLLDSEYADGACDSPGGNSCRFYLDERAFQASCEDYEPEDLVGVEMHRNEAAFPVLLRWAAEAGLNADPEALKETLDTWPVGVGGGPTGFALALGIGDDPAC